MNHSWVDPAFLALVIAVEIRSAMKPPRGASLASIAFGIYFVGISTSLALTNLHDGQWVWVLRVVALALVAYNVWREIKRRRKPKPAKAVGRVVDLGHRLAVRPD